MGTPTAVVVRSQEIAKAEKDAHDAQTVAAILDVILYPATSKKPGLNVGVLRPSEEKELFDAVDRMLQTIPPHWGPGNDSYLIPVGNVGSTAAANAVAKTNAKAIAANIRAKTAATRRIIEELKRRVAERNRLWSIDHPPGGGPSQRHRPPQAHPNRPAPIRQSAPNPTPNHASNELPQNQLGQGPNQGLGPSMGFGPAFGPGFNPGTGPTGFTPGMFGSGQQHGMGGGIGTGPGYGAGHGSGQPSSSPGGYSHPDPVGGFGGGGNFYTGPTGPEVPDVPGGGGPAVVTIAPADPKPQPPAEPGTLDDDGSKKTGDDDSQDDKDSGDQNKNKQTDDPEKNAGDKGDDKGPPPGQGGTFGDSDPKAGESNPNPDDPGGGDESPRIPGRGFHPHGGNTGGTPIGLPDPPAGAAGATGPFAGWIDTGGGDWGGNPHENPDPDSTGYSASSGQIAGALAANNQDPDSGFVMPAIPPPGANEDDFWSGNNPHYMPYGGSISSPVARVGAIQRAAAVSLPRSQIRFR